MQYEAFKLVGPQNNWHLAWVLEFPEVSGAEAWIDAEVRPPHSQHSTRSYFLARDGHLSTSPAGCENPAEIQTARLASS